MLIQTWSEVFRISLQSLWYGFVATFPKILLAVIIFILGWIVASTIGKIVTSALDALKLDKLFKSAGAEQALARAGWHLHIGKFFGELIKWFIIIVFLVASLNILNLDQVTQFLREVLSYIPNIIIAALVLIAGTILADFVRKLIAGGAAMAHVRSAKMIGNIAYYAIWVLAIVTALDKLGIFGYFGQIIFTGLVVMLALAFGLAFGIGGKDAAARWVNKISEDLSNRQ